MVEKHANSNHSHAIAVWRRRLSVFVHIKYTIFFWRHTHALAILWKFYSNKCRLFISGIVDDDNDNDYNNSQSLAKHDAMYTTEEAHSECVKRKRNHKFYYFDEVKLCVSE